MNGDVRSLLIISPGDFDGKTDFTQLDTLTGEWK